MCEKCHFTARQRAGIAAAILATLWLLGTASAGTMTIVDLPATGTDAAIGISATKVYTHAFDFGANAPVTINGVVLEQGPTANVTAATPRTSAQGFGYTITDTRSSINVQRHAGNDPSSQVDGDSAGLLRDMIYHAGSTAIGAGAVLILSDLTPGATYSFRWYYRAWGNPTPNRTICVQADGGHNGWFCDVRNVSSDGGGAHYLDYTYTCDDKDVTIRFLTTYTNNGAHIYGITNELVRSPYGPSPADRAVEVVAAPVLTWRGIEPAGTYNVYLGTSSADVDAATVAAPVGVLAAAGRPTTDFTPGRLEPGTKYYWRVDEVGAAGTPVKGAVWSFTVEPASFPLGKANITTTASSASANMGPEKTADGSGLNADDQHSTAGEDMWLSASDDPAPSIQYAFDQVYKLDRMLVWNSNQLVEAMIGFGAKAVKVEYSLDGTTWTALGDFQFAQGPALATYTANTTVDFAGAAAQFVRLSIGSNWGGIVKQYGLSEVRFFRMPATAAHPSPASGATGVDPAVTLSWRPGSGAASHQVFLGTDANAPLAATVAQASYATDLELGGTYYWKVVEVSGATSPSSWEGPVWSFSTVKGLAVDDMDSYGDDQNKGEAIFQTWSDGLDNPKANGATVGKNDAPFAEQAIYFAGRQCLPLIYDNTAGAPYSEARRTFDPPQDWTKYGCRSLVLYFFGAPDNTGQLYVKINGVKVLYGGVAADLTIAAWQPWAVDLTSVGTNLQQVASLAIGIDGAGAKGRLLVDEFWRYATAAIPVAPVDPGTQGLVAWYKLDGDAKDAIGGHDGTLKGAPAPFVPGKLGQAYSVTDDQTYVQVPYAADLGLNTFTVAVWVNVTDLAAIRGILGTRVGSDNTFDLKAMATMIHGDLGSGTAWLNVAVDIAASRGGIITTGVWHHLAYVVDNDAQKVRMYLDGVLAATTTFNGKALFMKSGQSLAIGSCRGTAAERMNGMIDDVRIYSRTLSDAEVAALAGRTGPIYQAP